jgi:protein involved in polysaccharide export with SLBB domain
MVGIAPNVARLLEQGTAENNKLEISDLMRRRGDEGENETIGDSVRRLQVENQAMRLVRPQGQIDVQGIRNAQGGQLAAGAQTNGLNFGSSAVGQSMPQIIDSGMDPNRLLNQIRPSLKEVNWDYALIERIRPDDLGTTLIPFDLGKAIIGGDIQHNLLLQPGDLLTIFSKEDIQVSAEKQTRFIRLEGEFKSAGVYQIRPGETLRQLVARMGGFTAGAYVFGAEFTRESTRTQQQKNLDESLNRLERDMQRASMTRSQNAITPEDASALKQQADSQQSLIARLRMLRPNGRIVLALNEDASLKDLPDLPLEDGDRFYVPSQPSMVTVVGSVYNENAYIYKSDKHVQDYLALAGGPTKDADQGSVYLLRADGSVISKRQSGFLSSSNLNGMRVMPGDSIVVPEELDRSTTMRTLKDFAQIFYQFGLGAAAIKVLKQ